MLEKIDLTKTLPKTDFKRIMPRRRERLYSLQKASWDAGLPVIIVFEGWDAAGKGTTIRALTEHLDPRGFKLYPIRAARTYEKKRPWLWRFWTKLPARGEIAIFDRSWYGRVLVERVENLIPEGEWRRGYRDIMDFERTLADDGHLILKFFLHISKQEQKRRFDKLLKDPMTAWKVAPEDWEHHRRYDEWELAYEEMFERTDSEWGPWTIVEATDRRFTQAKIFQTVIGALEERLGLSPEPEPEPELSLPAEINLVSEDIEEVWENVPEEDDLPEADEAPVASAEAS
jgi:AMP-polyphosphate phosphotransferase